MEVLDGGDAEEDEDEEDTPQLVKVVVGRHRRSIIVGTMLLSLHSAGARPNAVLSTPLPQRQRSRSPCQVVLQALLDRQATTNPQYFCHLLCTCIGCFWHSQGV